MSVFYSPRLGAFVSPGEFPDPRPGLAFGIKVLTPRRLALLRAIGLAPSEVSIPSSSIVPDSVPPTLEIDPSALRDTEFSYL